MSKLWHKLNLDRSLYFEASVKRTFKHVALSVNRFFSTFWLICKLDVCFSLESVLNWTFAFISFENRLWTMSQFSLHFKPELYLLLFWSFNLIYISILTQLETVFMSTFGLNCQLMSTLCLKSLPLICQHFGSTFNRIMSTFLVNVKRRMSTFLLMFKQGAFLYIDSSLNRV